MKPASRSHSVRPVWAKAPNATTATRWVGLTASALAVVFVAGPAWSSPSGVAGSEAEAAEPLAAVAADEPVEVVVAAELPDGPVPAGIQESPETVLIPAPEGLGLARTLERGQWELAYRYERSVFNKNRSGTRRQSVDDVRRRGFSEVPTNLDVEVHTLTVAGAPHDRVTLFTELPLVRVDMKSRADDGSSFGMRTRDVGDLEVGGLWHFMRNGDQSLIVKAGLGMPTGGTHAHGDTPAGRRRFPYPLQIGSGTFHFKPSVLYRGQYSDSSWGLRADGVVFLGRHDGYRRGDIIRVNGWYAHRLTQWMSSSLRLGWTDWDDLTGHDSKIDEDLSPAGDPNRQGGARLDLGPGLAFAPAILGGTRLAVEATWPLYQSLDGPQLESDWQLRAGWRWQF